MHPASLFDPGPIIGVQIYRRDVVVRRQGYSHPGNDDHMPERGKVTVFSKKSRQRLAFTVNNTTVEFRTMVTLTYPREYPTNGKAVKKHLNAFLTWARRRFSPLSYIWFLEFQKRGAPHIHLLLDYVLPQTSGLCVTVYREVGKRWFDIVGSGDAKHAVAGTRTERIRKPDGAARYALKYCYKMEQKWIPLDFRDVGRFWGCSRGVKPTEPRVIPMDDGTVRGILMDWDYSPDSHTLVYQTLYGCAERFDESNAVRVWRDLTSRDKANILPLSGSRHDRTGRSHTERSKTCGH